MTMVRIVLALATVVLTALAAFAQPAAAAPSGKQQHYDRQGLIDLTGRYLAAVVANAPGSVPLADGVQTVENLQRIRPGEGLWATATGGPTAFAVHVPDPLRQTAGFIGMMERNGEPILLGLRLQVERGRIVQAEHLIAAGLAEAGLPNLRTPRPGLLAEIPRGQRLPAHKLRAIGATYYDAVDRNDGDLAPFAPDCERHENGSVAAGPDLPPFPPGFIFPPTVNDCTGQIDSQVFTYIDRIDNRRVFAADPVTGLAMGLSHFRHPLDNVPYDVTLADGSVISFTPAFAPFDLPAAHIFKIGPDRRIHEIEATGFLAPLNSPTGW
jgi:hypothetical protein